MSRPGAQQASDKPIEKIALPSRNYAAFFQRRRVTLIMAFIMRSLSVLAALVPCVIIFLTVFPPYDGHAFWTIFLTPIFLFASITIHEGGHVIGARLTGMLLLSARIGLVELQARRDGWRLRICRPRLRPDAGGYVLAALNFSRPLRKQYVIHIIGGPLANLVVAILCGGAGLMLAGHPYRLVWFAFAAMNGLMGLANLVPNSKMGSDGYRLLVWLPGFAKDSAAVAGARLTWLMYTGTTHQDLPRDALDAIAQQASPLPQMRYWYAMKACQNLREWSQAIECCERIIASVAKLDKKAAAGLAQFLKIVHAELAFSRLMLDPHGDGLAEAVPDKAIDWYTPYIRPRYLALVAAVAGDAQECERLLAVSEREAENSIDVAQRNSEQGMRTAIRQVSREMSEAARIVASCWANR